MKQSYSLARRLRAAILAAFLCGGMPASFAADNITVDGINYSVSSDGTYVSVVAGNYRGDIVVPESVEVTPATDTEPAVVLPVKRLADYAFDECSGLVSVKLPDTVERIGQFAFAACPDLEHVDFGAGLTFIDNWAFRTCPKLKDVVLPDGIEYIENYVFGDCKSLTTITFPASIIRLGGHILEGCDALTEVRVQSTTPPEIRRSQVDYDYGYTLFDDFNYPNIPLYVPDGTKDAYMAADGWNDFPYILYGGEEPPVVEFPELSLLSSLEQNEDTKYDIVLGEDFTFTTTVQNTGTGDYEGSVYVILWEGEGAIVYSTDPKDVAIAAGGMQLLEFTLNVTDLPAGGYNLAVLYTEEEGDVALEIGTSGYTAFKATLSEPADDPDSISETEAAALRVYPNPAADYVCVAAGEGAGIVRVTSLAGTLLVEQEVAGGECRIDLSALPQGIYLITVETAGGVETQQLMKR